MTINAVRRKEHTHRYIIFVECTIKSTKFEKIASFHTNKSRMFKVIRQIPTRTATFPHGTIGFEGNFFEGIGNKNEDYFW